MNATDEKYVTCPAWHDELLPLKEIILELAKDPEVRQAIGRCIAEAELPSVMSQTPPASYTLKDPVEWRKES